MKHELAYSRFIWFPRTVGIAFIAFLVLFSLDVFSLGSIKEEIGAFIVHSLPSIIMAACLAIFWRRPFACGWVFIGAAVVFTIWFGTFQAAATFLLISLPPIVIGLLFFAAGKTIPEHHKREKQPE